MRRAATNPGRAFTLVEVIVATIIVGMIAASVSVVISRTFRVRSAAEGHADANARARSAVTIIARDLTNLARDTDLMQGRLLIIPGAADQKRDQVLLLARAEHAVRAGDEQNEAPIHEVQYRVVDEPGDAILGTLPTTTLWKREDPLPDEYQDAGGVATPAVPGVTSLSIEAYDGSTWTNDWDSDSLGYPLAVRITVSAQAGNGNQAGTTGNVAFHAVVRQVVAIDRTPLPGTLDAVAAPAATTPTTTPTNTPTTNPTNNGGNGGFNNPGGNGGGGNGGGRGGGGRGGGGRGGGGNGGGRGPGGGGGGAPGGGGGGAPPGGGGGGAPPGGGGGGGGPGTGGGGGGGGGGGPR